jgi:hypothetical protein
MASCAVTLCKPSTFSYGHGGHAFQYDPYQFAGRRSKAVSSSTGISFSDFSSMQVERRAVQQVRRLSAPSWAMQDVSLRAALLAYLEKRFFIRRSEHLTDAERLARIEAEAQRTIPRLQAKLRKLLKRYSLKSRHGRLGKQRLERLATQIQNLDTSILLYRRGIVAVVASAIFLYFRLGYDSVEIADDLGLKSPAVRQLFSRVRHVAEAPKKTRRRTANSFTAFELGKLRFLLANDLTVEQLAAEFSVAPKTVLSICRARGWLKLLKVPACRTPPIK